MSRIRTGAHGTGDSGTSCGAPIPSRRRSRRWSCRTRRSRRLSARAPRRTPGVTPSPSSCHGKSPSRLSHLPITIEEPTSPAQPSRYENSSAPPQKSSHPPLLVYIKRYLTVFFPDVFSVHIMVKTMICILPTWSYFTPFLFIHL